MRSVWLHLLQLAAALPMPSHDMPTVSSTVRDVQILGVDLDRTRFTIAPGYKDERVDDAKLTTSPLLLQLDVLLTTDLLASNIAINDQQLDVKWDTTVADGTLFATVASPSTQILTIPDVLGTSHFVNVSLSGFIPVDDDKRPLREPAGTQHLSLLVLSVDDIATAHLELDIVTQPTDHLRPLRKLFRVFDMQSAGSERTVQLLSTDTIVAANPFADNNAKTHVDEFDIEAEIESLLQLESQAAQLETQIAAKKHGLSRSLKDHRQQVPLGQLLNECDGVVCAAKVVAQRICDKMGVETSASFDYVQVQESCVQPLIALDEGDESERPATAPSSTGSAKAVSLATTGRINLHSSGATVRQSMEIIYPQSMLYRVLGVIACACGLTALFSFIRRKCMSARRMVDQLAEREERRNARAYRRAARRADMRKRWDAFVQSVNCFSMRNDEPRMENYEEKRALILQDAFMEQDIEAAEKGEVMEAEIRELRHAHEIVSSLVRVDENRYDLAPVPIRGPPPPRDSFAHRRSRSSTATLPSYTSDVLPDYSSRLSAISTTIASSRNSDVGTSEFSATASSRGGEEVPTAADTTSTPRTSSVDGSMGTRRSRLTEFSSIIEISPRASEETLRTYQRSSMAWSQRSWDTNDL